MAEHTDRSLRNRLIYQVFVRNYSEEGSFAAVERDLERIAALGTDIVYLLPIHPIGEAKRKGSLGSPYAIRDYRAINPEYGTPAEFRQLVEAIHRRGMQCMIDLVYNHTSPDSVLAAEHPDWFYLRPDGSFGNRVGDWTDIIDLDYANQALWDYQIETIKDWARLVDGFRCDVAPLVPLAFWERARREAEQVHPGLIWLAESAEPAFLLHLRGRGMTALSDGELYRAFDICYDYDIHDTLLAYLTKGGSLQQYAEAVNRQESIYPENYVKLRFLENHDQPRAAFLIPDPRALRNWTAFSLFQKGTAFLYAGQEYGASHRPGLFDRDTVHLAPENGVDMTELIRSMMRLKRDALFRESSYQVTAVAEDILVATHTAGKRRATGVFSLRGRTAHVSVPLPDGFYREALTGQRVEAAGGGVICPGEPMILLPEEASNLICVHGSVPGDI